MEVCGDTVIPYGKPESALSHFCPKVETEYSNTPKTISHL
jgi:hypothetical protein